MKRIILSTLTFTLILIPYAGNTTEPLKDPSTVEMIETSTTRPYSLITPLSSDKSSLEDAFADLRKKAAKLGADAVIEYECDKGVKMRGGGLLGLRHKTTVKAGCAGKAVKWTGEAIPSASESKPIKKKHS